MKQTESKYDLKITQEDIRELRKRIERHKNKQPDQIDFESFFSWWDDTFGIKPRRLLYKLKKRELDVIVLHVLGGIDMKVVARSCNYNFTLNQVEFLYKQAKETLIETSGCPDVLDLYRLSRHRILKQFHCSESRFHVVI